MSHRHSALIVPVWLLRLMRLGLLRLFIIKFLPVPLRITACVGSDDLCDSDKHILTNTLSFLSVDAKGACFENQRPLADVTRSSSMSLCWWWCRIRIFFIYNRKDKCLFLIIIFFYVNCSFCCLQIKHISHLRWYYTYKCSSWFYTLWERPFIHKCKFRKYLIFNYFHAPLHIILSFCISLFSLIIIIIINFNQLPIFLY